MKWNRTTIGDTEARMLRYVDAYPNVGVRFVKEDGSDIRSDKAVIVPDVRPNVTPDTTLRQYVESWHLPNLNAKVEFYDKLTGATLTQNRKLKNLSNIEEVSSGASTQRPFRVVSSR